MHIVFIYNNKYVSVLNVYQYFFNKHLFKDFSLVVQSYLQMCGMHKLLVQERSNINQDKIASINTLFLI